MISAGVAAGLPEREAKLIFKEMKERVMDVSKTSSKGLFVKK